MLWSRLWISFSFSSDLRGRRLRTPRRFPPAGQPLSREHPGGKVAVPAIADNHHDYRVRGAGLLKFPGDLQGRGHVAPGGDFDANTDEVLCCENE